MRRFYRAAFDPDITLDRMDTFARVSAAEVVVLALAGVPVAAWLLFMFLVAPPRGFYVPNQQIFFAVRLLLAICVLTCIAALGGAMLGFRRRWVRPKVAGFASIVASAYLFWAMPLLDDLPAGWFLQGFR